MLPALESNGSDTMHLAVNASLLVFDRRDAADHLTGWAEQNGGYFVWKSDDSVQFRVPDTAIPDLRAYLESISDILLDYGQSGTDLGQEILRQTSMIEAREEILARNLELLSSSDVEGTLELEREIRRLMTEIDRSKGTLRRLENDRRMAMVSVSLSFQNQSLPDYRPSNFPWINAVDFYQFIEGRTAESKRVRGEPVELPKGFAEMDRCKEFSAISAEGVRLRVIRLDNYPEQNADFWISALETDLRARGYVLVDDSNGSFENEGFESLLWGAAGGANRLSVSVFSESNRRGYRTAGNGGSRTADDGIPELNGS